MFNELGGLPYWLVIAIITRQSKTPHNMDIHLKHFLQEVKKLRGLQKRAAKSLNHSSSDFSSRRQLLAMAANQEKEVDTQIDYLESDHFQQELPF